jgi:hypothetical protein
MQGCSEYRTKLIGVVIDAYASRWITPARQA